MSRADYGERVDTGMEFKVLAGPRPSKKRKCRAGSARLAGLYQGGEAATRVGSGGTGAV